MQDRDLARRPAGAALRCAPLVGGFFAAAALAACSSIGGDPLTVFADPKNTYPTYWHVRDYGLMAANPFGRKKAGFHDGAAQKELVRLDMGEHLELRYGILLHDGDAKTAEVAANYQRFVKLREKE